MAQIPPLPQPVTDQVIVQYWEPENTLYWRTNLHRNEYTLLQSEIADYNKWINRLEHGKCPLSSYAEGEDEANDLLLAKSNKYQAVFERPGGRAYYEQWGYGFSIYNLTSPDEGDDLDEIEEVLDDGPLVTEPAETLRDLITAPYSSFNSFSMGYRVLPLTQKLLTEGRLG